MSRRVNLDSASDASSEDSFASAPPSTAAWAAAPAGATVCATAVKQRATQALGYRQQFAGLLGEHFNAFEAAGSQAPQVPCAPRNGKGSKQRFRGVTRHKRTQRFESHIWECKKQIYLGGFDSEALAAKAHDVMALRCKGGGEGEVLNFPRGDYTTLLPVIDRLSREDVVTALRNYSKSQTSKRMAADHPTPPRTKTSTAAAATGSERSAGPSSATTAAVHRLAPGSGVQKVAAQRVPRTASGAAGAAPVRRLSISVRSNAKPAAADGKAIKSDGPASPASPRKSFGGKVAPRPRLQQAAAAVAASDGTGPSKQRTESEHTHSPPSSPGPTTPHSRAVDMTAPMTPSIAAAAAAAAANSGFVSAASYMQWQASSNGRGVSASPYVQGPAAAAANALAAAGLVPGSPPHGSSAGSTAAVAAALEARRQYLAELYCQYGAHPGLPMDVDWRLEATAMLVEEVGHQLPPGPGAGAATDSGSANLQTLGLPWLGSHKEAADPAGPASCLVEDATPPAPACGGGADEMDCELTRLLEEPSLTFSASDDAYLFAPMHTLPSDPSCTALEHVNGTCLFLQDRQDQAEQHQVQEEGSQGSPCKQQDSQPAAITSVEGLGSISSAVPSPFAATPAVPHHSSGFSAATGYGSPSPAAPTVAPAPNSPGRLFTVLPASAVPHPPQLSAYSAYLSQPSPAVNGSAVAAALHQASLFHPQHNQVLLHKQPSAYPGLSPFALYSSASGYLA